MPFQISTRPSRAAVAAGQLGGDGAGEDHVAAGPADDLVAVADALGRCALGVRRAHRDVDAGLGPQPGDGGGVQLGAAGLDVGEVAPGQDVDAAQPGASGDVADLVDGLGPPSTFPVPSHATRTLPAAVELTGERPIEGQTPASLLALHGAGYREVLARIGPGRLLDLGCGLGDGSARLVAPDRPVVGVDYDPATAASARRRHPDVVTACCDAAALSLGDHCFDWVCSSHLIEHFADPDRHVAEVSRVLADGGAAFFITPNGPADFENPYHVHLFEPDWSAHRPRPSLRRRRGARSRRRRRGEGRLRAAAPLGPPPPGARRLRPPPPPSPGLVRPAPRPRPPDRVSRAGRGRPAARRRPARHGGRLRHR